MSKRGGGPQEHAVAPDVPHGAVYVEGGTVRGAGGRAVNPTARAVHEIVWEPYHSHGGTLRVRETSTHGTYEFCLEGGQFLVLRLDNGRYQEAGRGLYRQARELWEDLVYGTASALKRRARPGPLQGSP